jgi:hypothetical protein
VVRRLASGTLVVEAQGGLFWERQAALFGLALIAIWLVIVPLGQNNPASLPKSSAA